MFRKINAPTVIGVIVIGVIVCKKICCPQGKNLQPLGAAKISIRLT